MTLRARLGDHATFLGWLRGPALARAYAGADAFLFASQTDTFGQVILEAQASGLPVVAVDAGGPASLIEHGQSGMLAPPRRQAIWPSRCWPSPASPLLRSRLRRGGLAAVRGPQLGERAGPPGAPATAASWSRASTAMLARSPSVAPARRCAARRR